MTTKKLTPDQIDELYKWQRRMIAYFVIFLFGTLFLLLTGEILGPPGSTILFIAWILLLLTGVYIQFSQKCPNCGYRIGLSSRLLLPPYCPNCSISFRRSE